MKVDEKERERRREDTCEEKTKNRRENELNIKKNLLGGNILLHILSMERVSLSLISNALWCTWLVWRREGMWIRKKWSLSLMREGSHSDMWTDKWKTVGISPFHSLSISLLFSFILSMTPFHTFCVVSSDILDGKSIERPLLYSFSIPLSLIVGTSSINERDELF